jgi:hypothetical protein
MSRPGKWSGDFDTNLDKLIDGLVKRAAEQQKDNPEFDFDKLKAIAELGLKKAQIKGRAVDGGKGKKFFDD